MRARGNLLIVEDEGPLLETLALAARGAGFRSDTAPDGTTALRLLEANHYDVVATDLRLPDLSGAELMGWVVQRGRQTPVVVMTGYATLEAAVECLRKGAVDFLVKPFEPETFLESVTRAMEKPLRAGQGPRWEALAKHHALSRRELELVVLFHDTGAPNRDLARKLSVSIHTVKSHMKTIFLKLGVRSRAELLRFLRTPT